MLHAEDSVIKHNHAAADLASRFFQDDFIWITDSSLSFFKHGDLCHDLI